MFSRRRGVGLLGALLTSALAAVACQPQPPVNSDADGLPTVTETLLTVERCRLAGVDRLTVTKSLAFDADVWRATKEFYETRSDRATWWQGDILAPSAHHLLSIIREARQADGLDPHTYGVAELEALVASGGTPPPDEHKHCVIDLALTYRLALYLTHVARGRIAPRQVEMPVQTDLDPPDVDVRPLIDQALTSGRIDRALAAARPRHPWYAPLVGELARYRAIDDRGGWSEIPAGDPLTPGAPADPRRVRALERRLATEEYLEPHRPGDPGRTPVYDSTLVDAVRRFQAHHGLTVDGIVGNRTLSALNVTTGDRVSSLETTLDHMRWLPREPAGELRIIVNVPSFELHVVKQGVIALRRRAIVGRSTWKTPLLDSAVDAFVLNPAWHVPTSITRLEIAPKLETEPEFLDDQGFSVLDPLTGRQLDPKSIDWGDVVSGERAVQLRQAPGPLNPLGRIKFRFPSEFGVYLHDTSAPELFDRPERALSHGCLRLERPFGLVELLESRLPPAWSAERVRAAAIRGVQQIVALEEPVPIHVVYWTASLAADGVVSFHGDLYDVEPATRLAVATACS